jgi:hypothetical protein
MSYDRARTLFLLVGLILLGAISLVSLVRGVDQIEVAATLFFVPIVAGFTFFGTGAGIALAAAAAAGYVALRWPALQLVGFGPLAGQLTARIFGYVLFAAGGGWAAGQLKASLAKLELHDLIDDETGLFNARSVVETIDMERSRATRYQKVFSLVVAEFSAPRWRGRRSVGRLRELGARIAAAVRSVDHVGHVRDGDRHLLAVVLPETGSAGAQTVASNLRSHLVEITGDVAVRVTTATVPGQEAAMEALIDGIQVIDRRQHP